MKKYLCYQTAKSLGVYIEKGLGCEDQWWMGINLNVQHKTAFLFIYDDSINP